MINIISRMSFVTLPLSLLIIVGAKASSSISVEEVDLIPPSKAMPLFSEDAKRYLNETSVGTVVGLVGKDKNIQGSGILIGRNSILTSAKVPWSRVEEVVFKGKNTFDTLVYKIKSRTTYLEFTSHDSHVYPTTPPIHTYAVPSRESDFTCRPEMTFIKFEGLVGESDLGRINKLTDFAKSLTKAPIIVDGWSLSPDVFVAGYKTQSISIGGESFLSFPTSESLPFNHSYRYSDTQNTNPDDSLKTMRGDLVWGPTLSYSSILHEYNNHFLLKFHENEDERPDPLMIGSPVFRRTENGDMRLAGIVIGFSYSPGELKPEAIVVGKIAPCLNWLNSNVSYSFEKFDIQPAL